MLSSKVLIPKNLDYKKYIIDHDLVKLTNENIKDLQYDPSKKIIKTYNLNLNPDNLIPFPTEIDDLCRLHYIACSREAITILEFGLGKSTAIFGNALF